MTAHDDEHDDVGVVYAPEGGEHVEALGIGGFAPVRQASVLGLPLSVGRAHAPSSRHWKAPPVWAAAVVDPRLRGQGEGPESGVGLLASPCNISEKSVLVAMISVGRCLVSCKLLLRQGCDRRQYPRTAYQAAEAPVAVRRVCRLTLPLATRSPASSQCAHGEGVRAAGGV